MTPRIMRDILAQVYSVPKETPPDMLAMIMLLDKAEQVVLSGQDNGPEYMDHLITRVGLLNHLYVEVEGLHPR